MAYSYNPIPLQVQQANIGDILQKNQAQQMQYDDYALQRQQKLGDLAAQKAAQARQQQLQSLYSDPTFDINDPQSIAKIAALDPKAASNLSSMLKNNAQIKVADANIGYTNARRDEIGNDSRRKDQKLNIDAANASNAMQNRNAQTSISQARLRATQNEFARKYGNDFSNTVTENSKIVAAAPENERQIVAQQLHQQLKSKFGNIPDYDPTEIPAMVAMGNAALNAQAKGNKSGDVNFKAETSLRKEFASTQKDYNVINTAYNNLNQLSKSNTPQAQISLLYQFMKIQDPNSVVRESEFATAASAGSYGDKIQNAVTRLMNGQRLTNDQVKGFVNAAGNLYTAQRQSFTKSKKYYQGLANEYGLNPDRITYDGGDSLDTSGNKPPAQGSTDLGGGWSVTVK